MTVELVMVRSVLRDVTAPPTPPTPVALPPVRVRPLMVTAPAALM